MLATPVPAAEGSSATAGMNPPKLIEMAASKNGRVSGKNWKTEKTAKACVLCLSSLSSLTMSRSRSYISPSVKTPFAARQEAQKKKDAMKALEKEMKEEKEAEAER